MKFVQQSRREPRYFENEDGSTYLPIGLNLCFIRDSERRTEEENLGIYRSWMTEFAKNGGNFIRIWLGVPFFDIMPERAGEFSEKNLSHIRFVVDLAEKLGIRIKFTLEHFRRIGEGNDPEGFPGVVDFHKPLYQGMVSNMREYLASAECRRLYLAKAQRLAEAGFGESKAVIAWELWNEINCIGGGKETEQWSEYMIEKLSGIFPHQMIVQNLGSFSGATAYLCYDPLARLSGNGFLQVHRYLDPGAELDVCRGAMDVLCTDSIRELHDRNAHCPLILAECGAVEANHARYSDLYALDKEGTLLHDMLFAPFFAGSAGCGQPWHWDHLYIQRHHLLFHFARFAEAVSGVDPVEEAFVPYHTETHRLRILGLRGRHQTLMWCRDKRSDWKSELVEGNAAEVLRGERIPLEGNGKCVCYLPWEDRKIPGSIRDGWCELPEFRRSIVIKQIKEDVVYEK